MLAVPRAVQDLLSDLSGKFTAAHRLLRENGFGHVIQAENVADKHYKIFFVRNGNKNAKLGIIVAKKILPSSVDRNRAKRIIREMFRQHSIKLCNLDVVVMLRRTYPEQLCAQVSHLKMLLNKVENRCAEL